MTSTSNMFYIFFQVIVVLYVTVILVLLGANIKLGKSSIIDKSISRTVMKYVTIKKPNW